MAHEGNQRLGDLLKVTQRARFLGYITLAALSAFPAARPQGLGCTHRQQQGRSQAIKAHRCKPSSHLERGKFCNPLASNNQGAPHCCLPTRSALPQLCAAVPRAPKATQWGTAYTDYRQWRTASFNCGFRKRRNQSTSEAKKPTAFKFQHVWRDSAILQLPAFRQPNPAAGLFGWSQSTIPVTTPAVSFCPTMKDTSLPSLIQTQTKQSHQTFLVTNCDYSSVLSTTLLLCPVLLDITIATGKILGQNKTSLSGTAKWCSTALQAVTASSCTPDLLAPCITRPTTVLLLKKISAFAINLKQHRRSNMQFIHELKHTANQSHYLNRTAHSLPGYVTSLLHRPGNSPLRVSFKH